MTALFDLLLLIFVVFALPYITVSLVLARIWIDLSSVFNMSALYGSVSTAGLAVVSWVNRTPDNSSPFVSIVEMIAQAKPFGVPTFGWAVVASIALFLIAAAKLIKPSEGTSHG